MFENSLLRAIALASFGIPTLAVAPVGAASLVTYVSGKGTDSGTCASPASPCRTFAYAIGQASAGGEIKTLDPAHYGAVTITKSISITGVEGAGILRASAGNAITINAGANDVVNLGHLTLDGAKGAQYGIVLESAGTLNIAHCTVRNFTVDGIILRPSAGTTRFSIVDTEVSNNTGDGIHIFPTVTAVATGALERVVMHKNNGTGLHTDRNTNATIVRVTVSDSVASNNGIGFMAASQGIVRLVHSTSTDNGTGVFVNTAAESAGNNFIRGNTTDIAGFMANVGTQ